MREKASHAGERAPTPKSRQAETFGRSPTPHSDQTLQPANRRQLLRLTLRRPCIVRSASLDLWRSAPRIGFADLFSITENATRGTWEDRKSRSFFPISRMKGTWLLRRRTKLCAPFYFFIAKFSRSSCLGSRMWTAFSVRRSFQWSLPKRRPRRSSQTRSIPHA